MPESLTTVLPLSIGFYSNETIVFFQSSFRFLQIPSHSFTFFHTHFHSNEILWFIVCEKWRLDNHSFCRLDDTKSKLQRALLIDIHGRGRSDGINQLGYCLKKSDLSRSEIMKDQNHNLSGISSLATLFKENPDVDLIRGPKSLGAFIEKQGYSATPAPKKHVPGTDFPKLHQLTFPGWPCFPPSS